MAKQEQLNTELVSLNKFISSSGLCSRREADSFIEQGRVTVNDKPASIGMRIAPGDVVAVDGETVKRKKKDNAIYMAFNKPVGITSTTDSKDKTNIISYINYHKRIFPIGRLDKDSDGLILLTNDGDIVNKILRAENAHEKEYIVTVNKAINADFVQKMSNGIPILRKKTQKCFVRQEGNRKFRIILKEGMNRQIRRMCNYLDYRVVTLTRVRIMNIKLDKIPVGKFRLLTPVEVEELNQLVATSSKTQQPKKSKKERTPPKKEAIATPKTKPKKKEVTKKEASKKKPKNKSYKDYRRRR